MINKTQTKKLNRPMTIDLKYVIAKEYCEQRENKNLIIENMKKYISTAGIIWFIIVSLFGWGILTPENTNASNNDQINSEYTYY
ncbi:MAG: hypothetical protein ACTSRG_14760 [Candidatus Helarchaeota archaeon]